MSTKMEYTPVELDVISFDVQDIITNSGDPQRVITECPPDYGIPIIPKL